MTDGPEPLGEPLFRLTDAELSLFGAVGGVETPWLSQLSEVEHRAAVDAAYRSMLAHGAVEDDSGGLLVPEELVQILSLRTAPRWRLGIRYAPTGGRIRRHYLHERAGGVVSEHVRADGVHEFDIFRAADTRTVVLELLGMSAHGAESGGPSRTWRADVTELAAGWIRPPWGEVAATSELSVTGDVEWTDIALVQGIGVVHRVTHTPDGVCTAVPVTGAQLGLLLGVPDSSQAAPSQQLVGVKVRSDSPMK